MGRPRRPVKVPKGTGSLEEVLRNIETNPSNISRCYHNGPAYDEPPEVGFVLKKEDELHVFYGEEGLALWRKHGQVYRTIQQSYSN